MTDTQSHPLPIVKPSALTELEQLMRPFLAEQRRRRRQPSSGQVVTATGDGDTELSPSGCESSSTNIIRTVHVLVHHGTAPATATATADWSDVLCFSCGKSGHAATRCPNLNDSLPFMQPGWQTEKTPGGFIMIPPWVAMHRRRAENGG